MQIRKILSLSMLALLLASTTPAQPSKIGAFSHAPKLFGRRAQQVLKFAAHKLPKRQVPAAAARKLF